jgi:RHS repeat-associated protein
LARGGRAAGRAAEGIIAKLVKDLFRMAGRDAARTVARDAARTGARDVARDTARGGLRNFLRHPGETLRNIARSLRHRFTRVDPVDVATGEVVLQQVDVELPGLLPLLLTRTHVSSYRDGHWFGPSWASTVDQRIEVTATGVCYYAADGARLCYLHDGAMRGVLPVEGDRWPLTQAGAGWTVTDPVAGHTLHFAPLADPYAAVLPLVAVTDRNGHRIDLRYDEDDTLAEVRHSGGYRIGVSTVGGLITELRLLATDTPLVRFGYDTDRRLTEVTNSAGSPLRFDYDPDGRLTGWTDRTGTTYTYRYDPDGRCIDTEGTEDFLSATFRYEPDLTEVTDSLGRTTTYTISELGQVVAETDPLGHTTRTEWDRYNRRLSRTDPLGRTTRYAYDAAGNLAALTRPDGTTVTASYDERCRPVRTTDPDGAVRLWEYDDRGNLLAGTDPLGAVTRYGYGPAGQLAWITDAVGHTRRIETDAAGLPVAITAATGATTRFDRDERGRVTTITDPLGNVTRFGWTADAGPAWRAMPDGATDRWSYDAEGNRVSHTDPTGAVTIAEYGPLDLLVALGSADGGRLELAYDTECRLVAVTDARGLTWRYEYDAAGRPVTETDFDGRVLRYRWDAAGQLTERVTALGELIRYRRDLAGNVVEQDAAGGRSRYAYDPAGRLVAATNADAEVRFDRDGGGQVVAETCNGRTVASAWDALGRRTRRRTPSGVDSAWSYGPGRQPAELHTAGRTVRFGYDPAGREVVRSISPAAELRQAWDANSRLAEQTVLDPARPADRPAQHRSWAYRADGYPVGRADLLAGPRSYRLDPTGRVTAVDGPQWMEQYRYDGAGNLVAAAWPGGADEQGEREYAGSRLRRAGAVHYEHDGQGRLVRRRHRTPSGQVREWRYEWDAEDRLRAVTTPGGERWRYRYDPFGRRIAKQRLDADGAVAEEVEFCWDGAVLAEQAGPGGRVVSWDRQPESFVPVAQHTREPARNGGGGQFHAIVTDAVGTPTELVDPAGAIGWRAAGTVWGAGPAGGVVDCPLRFAGQYHDAETGANYNYHRYYDPASGRYATADPVGLAGAADPYAYVPNPAVWLDPLGLKPYDHIVLGLEAHGLRDTARKVGGRHLMGDANWQDTLRTAVGDPSTRFTFALDGLPGSSTWSRVMSSIQRHASGRGGWTDWELNLLHQSGRLPDVTFVEGGVVLPNPFAVPP